MDAPINLRHIFISPAMATPLRPTRLRILTEVAASPRSSEGYRVSLQIRYP